MTALIEMARKCGAHVMPVNIPTPEQAAEFAAMFPTQAALAAFAEMVRKDERERCAQIAEECRCAFPYPVPGLLPPNNTMLEVHTPTQAGWAIAASIRNQQGTQE